MLHCDACLSGAELQPGVLGARVGPLGLIAIDDRPARERLELGVVDGLAGQDIDFCISRRLSKFWRAAGSRQMAKSNFFPEVGLGGRVEWSIEGSRQNRVIDRSVAVSSVPSSSWTQTCRSTEAAATAGVSGSSSAGRVAWSRSRSRRDDRTATA